MKLIPGFYLFLIHSIENISLNVDLCQIAFFPVNSSFIQNWVITGKKAKESTKAVASNLHFDHQCQHCEKVMFFGKSVELISSVNQ